MLSKFCRGYLLIFILAVIGVNFIDAGFYTSVQAAHMMAGPTWTAPFGFDALGRNLFLRTLYSAQVSLFLGFISAISCLLFGFLFGWMMSLQPKSVQNIFLRFLEICLSIPTLLMLLVVSVLWQENVSVFFRFLPPAWQNILALAVCLSACGWFSFARFSWRILAEQKQMPYMQSAVVIGATRSQMWLRYIWPNVRIDILVFFGLQIPHFLLAEGLLSFLGFGIHSPQSSWGLLFFDGWKMISVAPHLIIGPAVIFSLTVFCLVFSLYRYQKTQDPILRWQTY
jgi:oligopeptide transport system permease protein